MSYADEMADYRYSTYRPAPRKRSGGRTADSEPITYLGFTITVRPETLTIFHPDGRKVYDGRMAFSRARSFIRGYRKSERKEPKPCA